MKAFKSHLKINKEPHIGVENFPVFSTVALSVIVIGCVFANIIETFEPTYMNIADISKPPDEEYLFGTDTLGRDIFSIIWHGGRISLFIGALATTISTIIAIIYGCVAGLGPKFLDDLLMRGTEIFLSVPQILAVIFLQAIWGDATPVSIGVVIGITSWMAISKMVRSEVRQVGGSDYVLASKTMGGGFFYIIWNHLLPNFMPAIMFMIITNLGTAMAMESTLSYLGVGLPVNITTWGSMMALSQRAMLTGSWWILLIPGTFLVATLICITNIGEYLRVKNKY